VQPATTDVPDFERRSQPATRARPVRFQFTRAACRRSDPAQSRSAGSRGASRRQARRSSRDDSLLDLERGVAAERGVALIIGRCKTAESRANAVVGLMAYASPRRGLKHVSVRLREAGSKPRRRRSNSPPPPSAGQRDPVQWVAAADHEPA